MDNVVLSYGGVKGLERRYYACDYLFPVFVDKEGEVQTKKLVPLNDYSHIFMQGIVGSGKSMSIRFLVAALNAMYDDRIEIVYIDSKGTEHGDYEEDGVFCGKCGWSVYDGSKWSSFRSMLDDIYKRTEEFEHVAALKKVYIFDEFTCYNDWQDTSVQEYFIHLLKEMPYRNIHAVLATHRCMSGAMSDYVSRLQFNASLRCGEEMSVKMFGDDRACSLEHGQIIVKEGAWVAHLRTPYFDREEYKDILRNG